MNKIVATILLDPNDKYICEENRLPTRPLFDKELLYSLVKGETISQKGWEMLPPSMRADVILNDRVEPYPITVDEIGALTDILIVSRSNHSCKDGKVFRLDKFKLILKQPNLEIYRRK
jgi:hypothetical protein